jgi:peptidoglycan/LPS O-acetylase OafA/YrhL
MLVHHITEWLSGDARDVLPGWPDFAVTDVAAVAFFCAAGASMALFTDSRRRRGDGRLRVAGEVARRYGLLVPLGMALHWLLWGDLLAFGVLEALGVSVVLGAVVVGAVPARLLPTVAVATVVAGVLCERLAVVRGGPLAEEVLAGIFPLVTYVGFVVVGAAVARGGWLDDRRAVAGAVVIGVAATALMLARGVVPDRYPGEVAFVVPGLAGAAVVFALSQVRWPAFTSGADRVLRLAGLRALGIFVAHYLLLAVLWRAGVSRSVEGAPAVAIAIAVTAAICVVAPHVPELPWSPRRGRRVASGHSSWAARRLGATRR